MATVNGKALLCAEIRMPRIGAWRADIQSDDEADRSGTVTIEIDGLEFVGTALPGRFGVNGTRVLGRIVGGAGMLTTTLPAKSYESPSGVRVGAILADILRECGETLSSTAEAATVNAKLRRWHRASGPAQHAIASLMDRVGADWRVLADGTVWIGAASWPEANLPHVLEDEDWTTGVKTIAPDTPALTPGVTFLGMQVERVVHRVNSDGELRTEAHSRSVRDALQAALGRVEKAIQFSRMYRARVASQNADGTLQLVPDDEEMKGRGLDKVPIRNGLPGFVVKVLPGARVMFGFNGANPDDPYVAHFDEDGSSNLTSIEYKKNGLSAPLARVGDAVAAYIPYTPVPVPGSPPLPITAVIQVGNPGALF